MVTGSVLVCMEHTCIVEDKHSVMQWKLLRVCLVHQVELAIIVTMFCTFRYSIVSSLATIASMQIHIMQLAALLETLKINVASAAPSDLDMLKADLCCAFILCAH